MDGIKELDRKEESEVLSLEERLRRDELKLELEKLCTSWGINWRQKSITSSWKNHITMWGFFIGSPTPTDILIILANLEMDRISLSEQQEVKESISHFYKNFYSESEEWKPRVENLYLFSLSETSCRWLERDFTKEGILEALHDKDGDKALDPNEYTIAFFKHCWDTVEGNALHPRVYHSL